MSSDQRKGTLRWFNRGKEFGFIKPDEGGRDMFLHKTALHRLGVTRLPEGTRLAYDVEENAKGKKSAINIRLLDEPLDVGPKQKGTVKFFNAEKGWGFIKPAKGGKDVFVHVSALRAADIPTLYEGQGVMFVEEIDRDKNNAIHLSLSLT
jgi:CspA family cold shock protein